MMRMRQRRRRSSPAAVEISLTPLIDTALTLLVIFMVATPMMHNAIKVNLPQSTSNDLTQATPEEVVVYIDKDQHVFLNGEPVTENALLAHLEKELKGKKEQLVFIKGDRDICYGKLIDIYDEIKGVNGVKYVAFATQKKAAQKV